MFGRIFLFKFEIFAFGNICNWQHVQMTTCATRNTGNGPHVQLVTHATGNMCNWQHVQLATCTNGNMFEQISYSMVERFFRFCFQRLLKLRFERFMQCVRCLV